MSIQPGCAKLLLGLLIYAVAFLQLGCTYTIRFPDGTHTIGEVAHVLSRQEILTGDIEASVDNRGREQIKMPRLYESLLKDGMKDEELVDGSVVLNRVMYGWYNVTSGIVRQSVNVATVTKDLAVTVGNIVEVENRGGNAVVVRIRYMNLADGHCEYRLRDRGTIGDIFDALNPIGGPGEASLYCPEIEKEGWYALETTRGIQWYSKPPEGEPLPPVNTDAPKNDSSGSP
jgi:hypothetical protein